MCVVVFFVSVDDSISLGCFNVSCSIFFPITCVVVWFGLFVFCSVSGGVIFSRYITVFESGWEVLCVASEMHVGFLIVKIWIFVSNSV